MSINSFAARGWLCLGVLASGAIAQARVLASCEQAGIIRERLVDTDGDGRDELVLVRTAVAGRAAMLRFELNASANELTNAGSIDLEDPKHTLIDFADLLPSPGVEVVVADGRGITCRSWTAGAANAAITPIVRRARCRIRVGEPQLSPFATDLNRDGKIDLMLPTLRGVQPYLHEGAGDSGAPQFRRMGIVQVPIRVEVDPGSRGLDQELIGRLQIPQISSEDLNGDGRPDLLTRDGQVHAFHIQSSDGSFAAPIEVDISQFEDSTPKATIELGSTAVLGDRQLLQRGDISGDGIPDYVIAHRRKIWTFIAGSDGPQFRRARPQAVADDVTALLVVDIDEDDRADLLTFRVQIPGIGALLLGLVRSIDIDIKAVGYPSETNGFANQPKWRRTVTLRIPPILSIISRQDELIERFTDLISKARISARGEFRQPGVTDVAVASSERNAIQLFTDIGEAPTFTTTEGRRMMRRLLFEDEETVFDIDRIFALASGFLDSIAERVVGDREAVATIGMRDVRSWRLVELVVGELDGQQGKEVVAIYRSTLDDRLRAYDVLAWR